MSGTKYDSLETVKHIAEGRGDEYMQRKAAYRDHHASPPPYVRFVILEVISDPMTLDKAKLSFYEHELKVANVQYAAVAPRNSVIARRVMGQDAGASEKVMVLYPFLPPHIAVPAKPGEHVWGMFEHTDANSNDIGYWMWRIVQPNFVEDVNHTHADRQYDKSFLPGLSDVFEGTDDPKYEFPNGVVDQKDGSRYVIAGTATLPDDEKAYEKLLKETDASKQIVYESIPRYRKRPADMAFEGTNNTLIVLGTDRSGPLTEYDTDPNKGKVPKPATGDLDTNAGMIDIVVGRGTTDDTAGKQETNSLGRKELGKTKKDVSEKEGDPDPVNDRSRIAAFQRTNVDKRFNLTGLNATPGASGLQPVKDSANGDAAIVIKTDKLRLIAREDVEIVVISGTPDSNGRMIDGTDPTQFAAVILKSNGDIVLRPSAAGLVLVGGADADLAPLCTHVHNKGAGGTVVAQPIIDTMGGAQGIADGLNGTFAKKVLFK